MCENIVVHVKDCAALRVDDLLVTVFFRGEFSVLVVLDHLKVNQPKRENAEEHNECRTNQRTAPSTIRVHRVPDWLITGRIAFSRSGRGGNVSRTMLFSEIGIIFK